MNGAFLQILAESEPFWKHPAVVVLLIIIAVTIVFSIVGALMKLIGISLLTIVFWPIMKRTGRYLFLGVVLAVLVSPAYKGRLEALIKPKITPEDAMGRINRVLEQGTALNNHLRFAQGVDPIAPVTAAVDSLASSAERLKGLRGTAAWKTVGPAADRALASLDTILNRGKELRDVRTDLGAASTAFWAALETARSMTSVETVNDLTGKADTLRQGLRREHRALRALDGELPHVIADVKTAQIEMSEVPSAAGLLSEPIKVLEGLGSMLENLVEETGKARRQARRVYKVGLRHIVVEELPDGKREMPPAETTSGSVQLRETTRTIARLGATP